MRTPIDFEEIDTSDDGYGDFLLDGKLFSGIAYERDPNTNVIVVLGGFERGKQNGCSRTWSPSGVLIAEEFYLLGVHYGPARTWNADGTSTSNQHYGCTHEPLGGTAYPVVDIDLDEMEFVEHPWGWGNEPAPPLPSTNFTA